MLNNISWISYLIFISLSLFIYYLAVLLYYYRAELLQLTLPGSRRSMPGAEDKIREAVANGDPDLFPVVHVLMGKLGSAIELVKRENKSKDEFLSILHNILSQESGILNTPFEPAIINFLREEAKKQCAVLVSEEELRRVWDG